MDTSVRAALQAFLSSVEGDGGFAFQRGRPATLLSNAFAGGVAQLIGDLDRGSGLVERLRSAQRDDGHFVDSLFRLERTNGSHQESYIQWQFTFFSLSVLDMLGGKPAHDLTFLNGFRTSAALDDWLEARNWQNFWYGSNEVMFLLYFLTYLGDPLVDHVLDRLDQRQDPETGLWGTDVGATVENGVYGAAHIYMFYDHVGREIRHPQAIIDHTLPLQRPSGLWGKDRGGACEDYDAVEILLKVGRQCEHRRSEVDAALDRTARAIAAGQAEDGGFPYWIEAAPGSLKERWAAMRRKGSRYHYSGWLDMESERHRSDLWATWFRALALATIAARDDEVHDFGFYRLPAWGYDRRATI